MRKAVLPLLALAGFIFMTAPIIIARAPYESTMGLVQKIFYFHMPPAMLMLLSAIFCGIVSAIFLIRRRPIYDWMAYAPPSSPAVWRDGVVTGPLGRGRPGRLVGVGSAADDVVSVWLIFVSYLLCVATAARARRWPPQGWRCGMATLPFVYLSVNIWRTIHPLTTGVPTLPVDIA